LSFPESGSGSGAFMKDPRKYKVLGFDKTIGF